MPCSSCPDPTDYIPTSGSNLIYYSQMEKFWLHGNLEQTPFAFLLFRIWKANHSGELKIKNKSEETIIEYNQGRIAPTANTFLRRDFIRHLEIQNEITGMPGPFFLRRLLEKNNFTARQLWPKMRDYMERKLYPLFNWTEAEYFFDAGTEENSRVPFLILDTREFILEGIRSMSNFGLMERFLPPQEKKLTLRTPDHFGKLPWKPWEEYLIRLLQKDLSAEDILNKSQLGRLETKRVLFLLQALDMLGAEKKTRFAPDISSAEIQRIWNHFNELYVHVFKFLAKEMGPVAFKVLEKSILDTKSNLHQGFHNVRLEASGHIVIGATPLTPVGLPGGMNRTDFLNSLNEILNAEILLVKKTLGNESESVLVKSLNSMGE